MKVLIIAGEESGDVYAGRLASHLLSLTPDLVLEGIGGQRMREAGVETLYDIEKTSSVGVASMLGKLGGALSMLRDIKARLFAGEYSAVILVDYPDFNMQVAKAASGASIPVIYYVCPQFWAWRRGRVEKARKWVDLMLVVFPFEEGFYRQRGIDARFLGHPLLDELPPVDKEQLRKKYCPRPGAKLVGAAPGSRHGEVAGMFPVILESIRIIRETMDVEVAVPCALSVDEEKLSRMAAEAEVEVKIYKGKAWEIMNACDFLICKSGTSTLQAALANAPMVILYKADFFSYHMARLLSYVQWAGLPNILADKQVVPELLQSAATAPAIAKQTLKYLLHKAKMDKMRSELEQVGSSLGPPGASMRAAQIIADKLASICDDSKATLE